MKRLIYLDNAATTKLHPQALEEMLPYLQESYGNPSAVYSLAGQSAKAVSKAREQVAKLIGARKEEIYFTSGGSEADNWAIKAAAESMSSKGKHIITTKIEHHAVLHTCEYLEKQGFQVTYLDVDSKGFVDLGQLEKAIRSDTILISIMAANNEIGTLQPLQEIGNIAKAHGVLFHTDAVQAVGHVPIGVEACRIDMLSASAHKLHGPKGVGMLYIRRNVKLPAFMHGGAQERHRRAGTLNVPAIVGFGKAAEIAMETMQEKAEEMSKLRDYLIERVLTEIPESICNGDRLLRLPNNISFCFPDIEGESLLILMDQQGICASGGSACTTGAVDPSHVLQAIGVSEKYRRGVIRISLSEFTTKEEIDITIEVLKKSLEKIKSIMCR